MNQDKKENEGNAVEERMKEFCKDAFGKKNNCPCDDCDFWRCHWSTIYKKAVQETAEKIRDEIESLKFTDFLSKKLIKYDDKGYVLDRLSINTMVCDAIENSKILSKYGVKK